MADERHGPIGVVLIDDHRMFAESLGRLLDAELGIDILGIAVTGRDGIEKVARLKPHVALVDFQMPGSDGIAVASEIVRGNAGVKVVILTGSTDERVLLAAIEAGCAGVITKDRAADEVAEAVRRAAAGEAFISPAALGHLLSRLSRSQPLLGHDLTDREREVLGLLALGWSNKVIAAELYLSLNTVRNYVQRLITKLGTHSKLEAVATATREGIIGSRPAVS
jgi:DNA-binding NarL/FixJ family response regulator